MANQKLEIMRDIMKKIDEGIEPKAQDYGLSQAEFGAIVEMCQEKGFIKGARFSRGGPNNEILVTLLNGAKLTFEGLEYLEKNAPTCKHIEE